MIHGRDARATSQSEPTVSSAFQLIVADLLRLLSLFAPELAGFDRICILPESAMLRPGFLFGSGVKLAFVSAREPERSSKDSAGNHCRSNSLGALDNFR